MKRNILSRALAWLLTAAMLSGAVWTTAYAEGAEGIVPPIEETVTDEPESSAEPKPTPEETEDEPYEITFTLPETLYFAQGEEITEADLLSGVSAMDESGATVDVTVADAGGLDLSDPQPKGGSGNPEAYVITYEAEHPATGETFSETRDCFVTLGIAPLASVGATIDMSDANPPTHDAQFRTWTYSNDVYLIEDGANVTIIGDGTGSQRRIEIQPGATANVTLDNAVIEATKYDICPFLLGEGSNVTLTVEGDNNKIMRGAFINVIDSPVEKAGIQTTGASITIKGTGKLTVGKSVIGSGAINVLQGAGIGGSDKGDGGNIKIEDSVTIDSFSYNGAGIGGGRQGDGGNIYIGGNATVISYGGRGAGIGGGLDASGGHIIITDNADVTTNSTDRGAAIGGGRSGDGGIIEISGDATVTATASIDGAAIGGGSGGGAGIITIDDNANVTATAPFDFDLQATGEGAGIGGGSGGSGGEIYIKGGTVTAYSHYSAGIGNNAETFVSGGNINGNDWDEITPRFADITSSRTSDTAATVALNSSHGGTLYYIAADTPPSVSELVANGTPVTLESAANTLTLTNLTAGDRTVYIVGKEGANSYIGAVESFVVSAFVPVYGVTLELPDDKDFGRANYGYAALTAHEVTVANVGNIPTGSLTVELSGANALSFAITDNGVNTGLDVDESESFKVAPKIGLLPDTYNATVTVGGDKVAPKSFKVSFTVNKLPQGEITIKNLAASYTYGDAAFDIGADGGDGNGTVTFVSDTPTVASVSGKTVTIHKAGTFRITATKAEDNIYFEKSKQSPEITVLEATPAVKLTGADTPTITFGKNVTLTAEVSGAGAIPGGMVTFKEGSNILEADVPLVNGIASHTVTAPAVGNHSYSAVYSGQADYYAAATSAAAALTVSEPNYGITLTPAGNKDFGSATFGYGDQSAHIVTVENVGDQPTGNLTAELSGTNPGSFTVSDGNISGGLAAGSSATITVTPDAGLLPGIHNATVTVKGNNGIEASFGVSFAVEKLPQGELSITNLATSYTYGGAPFDIDADGGDGDGIVTFVSDTPTVASVNGKTVTIRKAGSFRITATKAENDIYLEKSKQSLEITVLEATPEVKLTGADVTFGKDIMLTAEVSGAGAIPGGTVTFKEGSNILAADVPLVNGIASHTVTAPAVGNHSFSADYSGQPGYYKMAAGSKSVGVGLADQIELTIKGKPATVTYGDGGFKLSADGGSGTGGVTFSVSNDDVVSITTDGHVTIENAGTVKVTAVKAGDASYNEASAELEVIVKARDINEASVTVTGETTYTGSQLQPGFSVTDGMIDISTSDYVYDYGVNVNAGTDAGSVALNGQGNYTGIKTVKFDIQKTTPVITSVPTASAVEKDGLLSTSKLSGGAADFNGVTLPGEFSWDDSAQTVAAAGSFRARFTPTDSDNFEPALCSVSVGIAADQQSDNGDGADRNNRRERDSSADRNPSITPRAAVFDKAAPGDVAVVLRMTDNKFQGLINGGYTLIENSDYTADGGTYTIKAAYLGTLDIGEYAVTFDVNTGTDPKLRLTVIDSSTELPSPVPETQYVNPFADINPGDWYYSAVGFVNERGLMNGTETYMFSPNQPLTRGMIVTILWIMAGSPEDGTGRFNDVPEDAYYYQAANWAAGSGIVSGTGYGMYSPDAPLSRQDLAVILANYAKCAGLSLPGTREYSGFMDDADIANYAKEAIEEFFKARVINGKGGNNFDPQGEATRAEVAAMLMQFIRNAE